MSCVMQRWILRGSCCQEACHVDIREASLQDSFARIDRHEEYPEEACAEAGRQRLDAHVEPLGRLVAVQQRQRARVGGSVAKAAQRALQTIQLFSHKLTAQVEDLQQRA